MSSTTWSTGTAVTTARSTESFAYSILKALGSLKITVTMFTLAIFIVLFGTLAQDEMDLATVKREFFNCWIAHVPVDVLFPITLVPHDNPILGGFGFYFPGGATIGLVLLINLIAAKTTRFSVASKGLQLWGGILVSLVGAALVVAVIISGHAANGLQGQPPVAYDTLWGILKAGCALLTVALIGYSVFGKMPPLARTLAVAFSAMALAISLVVLTGGEAVRLDDPGLRIVWQLLQASIASLVLLVGLWMVFKKRGGNVLIHIGVGLLMVGQFVFGDRQIEQRIGLAEGSSTNLAVIEDEIEIAIIDTSDPDENVVYAIPEAMIRNAPPGKVIDDESLPVKVRILQYMENAVLQNVEPGQENPATDGLGQTRIAKPIKPYGGAVADKVNLAAAYVELIDKQTNDSIGTYLLAQEENDQAQLYAAMLKDNREQVEIDGKPFELAIRYRQERKGYDVFLKDVQRIDYSGTETPRDYSSVIVITDRETGESQEDKTWMNNPIRYQGETFYQSRYNKLPAGGGRFIETTGLQVVENAGWVIPYVSCMMVFWGMFAHFGGTFFRFANKYSRGATPVARSSRRGIVSNLVIGVTCLVFCGAISGYFAKLPTYDRNQINWTKISQLPTQHEGRIKPFDTVARNILQRLSEPIFGATPYVKDAAGDKHTPTEWLLGVMAGQEWVRDAQVFRVYAKEARSFMDLEPRKGYRYSYNEIEQNIDKLREEIEPLRGQDPDSFSFREQKLVQLHSKLNLFDLIALSYMEPPLPSPQGIETEEQRERFFAQVMRVFDLMQNLESGGPPAVIPPVGEATESNLVDAKWQAFGPARFKDTLGLLIAPEQRTENPAISGFASILDGARQEEATEVNKAVRAYERQLEEMPLAAVSLSKASTESWLNKFNPTAQGVLLYLLAIAMGFASFLIRWDGMRKATFWVLVAVFIIHTIAIVSRIYISGRAPVINLYSSAVFIGWACVLLGLILEAIYPVGIANLVSGIIGVSTISVARFLDTSDTMPVLQAVLDTQFWLSTHVITVTAGYAVTFLAGFLGICALVHRMVTSYDSYPPEKRPKQSEDLQKILYSMCYGVICFAIFFSFIGTVLGGLWADDSWGRFWGWDPKENGAMMIVLWNAILLHARWDKQVGPRGFAALAVIGNVVTAWSWFGTNQLGIGLHSYGFTSGALMGLGGFVLANLVFVVVALIVTRSMALGAKNSSAT